MKFISKSTNLLVVLRPGLPAQPLAGLAAKPTLSVRFKDGVAEVPDGELAEMMLAHPGFDSDFVSALDTDGKDPYAHNRSESEPAHQITNLKYGTPEEVTRSKGQPIALPPEVQKLVQEEALKMAKGMLPEMVKETLKALVQANEEDKKTTPAKPRGRPAKKTNVQTETIESTV